MRPFLLALMLILPCFAAPMIIDKHWALLAETGTTAVYLDVSKVQFDPYYGGTTAWIKDIDSATRRCTVRMMAYSTNGDRWALVLEAVYALPGNATLSSFSFKPNELDWSPVVPGTVGERIRDSVLDVLRLQHKKK